MDRLCNRASSNYKSVGLQGPAIFSLGWILHET